MMSALLATPAGLYRQPCACSSRRRLADRRAKHLRKQARRARVDADLAEIEGDHGDAADFRALASECAKKAHEILGEACAVHSPCLVCGSTGEVRGNGTYGGRGHRTRVTVMVF